MNLQKKKCFVHIISIFNLNAFGVQFSNILQNFPVSNYQYEIPAKLPFVLFSCPPFYLTFARKIIYYKIQ